MDIQDDTQLSPNRVAVTVNNDPSHAEVVAAAIAKWTLLGAHLSPLIGEAGFNALYGRTLHLIKADHPWMTTGASSQSTELLFSTLKANLLSIDQAHAEVANTALLATFIRLMSGLIGEALTARLLNTAWADEPEEKNK